MGSAGADSSAFVSLKSRLVRDRKLFEDPDFPAGPSSIRTGDRWSSDSSIKWIRPKEFCSEPKFIVQGATRFDLNQGTLNDCWFIAASACLATTHKQLFEWCVPPNQDFDKDYAGIFRFNFWQFGSWVQVVIDDRLPCQEVYEGGKKRIELVYARNDQEPNEFWVPLFEKAYAKLNGCYQNLNGGFSSDALVDFTGGISEYIDITPKRRSPGNLFEMISAMMRMSSLLGTHINGGTPRLLPNGLYTGHAYSITKVVQLDGTPHRLMRIRNPWGKDEWNGRWSDSSNDWSLIPENVKKALEVEKKEDGEFWMSFEDWLANFDRLTICHLYPDAVTDEICSSHGRQQWHEVMFGSQWVRGINAGGSGGYRNDRSFWQNPQFSLSLEPSHFGAHGACHVVVSLLQRAPNNQCTLDIGFTLGQLKEGVPLREFGENYQSNEVDSVEVEKCINLREVSAHYELKAGNYVIIPCTQYANAEGDFLLRVYTEI